MGFFSKLFSGKDSKKESDQDPPAQEGEAEIAAAAPEPAPPSERPARERPRANTARARQPSQAKVIVDGFPAPGRSTGTDPGLTPPVEEPRRPTPRQARPRTTTEPAFPAPGADAHPSAPVASPPLPAVQPEPAPRPAEVPSPAAAPPGPRAKTVRVEPATTAKPATRPALERNIRSAERPSSEPAFATASPSREVAAPTFAPPPVETRPQLRQRNFDLQRTEPPPLVAGTIGASVASTTVEAPAPVPPPAAPRRPNGTPAAVKDADTAPVSVRSFDFKSTFGRSDSRPIPVEARTPAVPQPEPQPERKIAPVAVPLQTKPEPPVNGTPSIVDNKPTAPIVTAPIVTPPAVVEKPKPVEDPFSSALDWDLDGEFDKAFEGAQAQTEAAAGEGTLASDERTEAELQGLFAQMAAFHLGQVRDFIIELSTDEASKQWVEICRGAVSSMATAAERLKFTGVAETLASFSAVLDEAHARPETRIRGELRARILERFEALRNALPQAFAVAEERDRREPIIIHALLSQIEGVQVLERDRLYAAGVNRLSVYYEASAVDIASTTGMSIEVARRIKQRFDQYRRERADATPDEGRSGERKRLRTLIETLGQRDIEFAAAERADDGPARRRLRKERANLMHEIEVVLAQIGEVDLVARLSRVPVDRKIETIESYLRKPVAAAMG